MAPATHLPRTYSRKSLSKRKRGSVQETDCVESASTGSGSRKRFKSTGNRDDQESVAETGVNSPSTPSRPRIPRTYGSAAKRHQNSPTPTSPSKPVALARDLSEVFKSVTPSESPVSTPRKLASRMLARSKTESSLETSPSHSSAMERTPSLPTLPSTPSKGKRKEVEVEPPFNPLLPLARPPSNVTRTYAGPSRSFLITMPASSLGTNPGLLPPGMNVEVGDEEDEYLNRESYSSLRARWGVDNSEDDPYPAEPAASPSKRRSRSGAGTPSGSPTRGGRGGKKANVPSIPLPPNMMNPLKSITELRSKGESRRFLDEIGYLFEGMEKSGALSLRRTSALDIVTKLCDAEFARRAKAADFLPRIWDIFIDAGAGQNEDKILDLLLAFLAALVAKDGSSLADLAQRSSGSSAESYTSFVDTVFRILGSCTNAGALDLLRLVEAGDGDLKRAGMTKKDRNQLVAIYNVITSKSRLFPRKTIITTPLLITYTLQRLPTSLIDPGHLPTLLRSLRVSLSPLVSSSPQSSVKPTSRSSSKLTKTYAPVVVSHLEWRNAIPRICFETINAHLQLLDTFLLGQWRTPKDYSTADEGKNGQRGDPNAAVLDQEKEEWLLETLIALAICAEMKMRKRDKDLDRAGECLDLILRILVSQTHSDEGWSHAVLQIPHSSTFMMRLIAWSSNTYYMLTKTGGESIDGVKEENEDALKVEDNEDGSVVEVRKGDESDEEVRWQDRLCLTLGLLANLVQAVGEVKNVVRETRIDPNCPLVKGACILSCRCPSLISGLDVLMRVYGRQDDSLVTEGATCFKGKGHADEYTLNLEDDRQTRRVLDALSLLGHLAVLFGLLMRGNRENEELIVAGLPTRTRGEGRKTKLSRLLEQARELVSFDAAVTSVDAQDDGVARDVVAYLKELTDASRIC